MKEVSGRFNTAKIFTDVVDDASLEQIQALCNQEFTKGSAIRIMPDVHAGAGCTIGTTMTVLDKIVPNLVGVDIGCGMAVYVLKEKDIDVKKLDEFIYASIPSGRNIRLVPHKYMKRVNLDALRCRDKVNGERAALSLGTLGGGNHFIEVDRDEDGRVFLVIHSGSRYLGKQVAEYYQEEAFKSLSEKIAFLKKETIERLKKEGKESEIKKGLVSLKEQGLTDIPKPLAYLEGKLFDDYIHDMKIVQAYAVYNRQVMAEDILNALGLHVEDSFTTIHNYIDTEAMILRKGAVSAKAGEVLLIPVNMRDGSLVCVGKGNPDWNFSAPHGAGRLYSRLKAKQLFNMETFQKSMEGIYTTSVHEETLDECPMAYKRMEDIVENITPAVRIERIIRPVYNFKAGETADLGKGFRGNSGKNG